MRLDRDNVDHTATVALSYRNLLSLRAKLNGHPPNSQCTIRLGGTTDEPELRVTAVPSGPDLQVARVDEGLLHVMIAGPAIGHLLAGGPAIALPGLTLTAEADLLHYADRPPPGPMHPTTDFGIGS
ncbi:MAG TPA: hypothetical protein VMV23_07630 [Candidatus Nanopelagicaceae bacterium]|nr:hypothetical protein [Candidatus Nanopelagicaceae bacterium]